MADQRMDWTEQQREQYKLLVDVVGEMNPKAVISGTLSSDAVERIMEAVEDLDVDKRVSMTHRQQSLIDGRGSERLAERLIEKVEIMSRDAKNENSLSQGENGVLTRIQKSSGYSPEA
jgi:hypothetical protein